MLFNWQRYLFLTGIFQWSKKAKKKHWPPIKTVINRAKTLSPSLITGGAEWSFRCFDWLNIWYVNLDIHNVAGNRNWPGVYLNGWMVENFWSSSSWLHFADIGKSASENWKTRLKDIFSDQLSSPNNFPSSLALFWPGSATHTTRNWEMQGSFLLQCTAVLEILLEFFFFFWRQISKLEQDP